MSEELTLTCQCKCAAVKYDITITGEELPFVVCHCPLCRKHAATAFATYVGKSVTFSKDGGKT